MKSGSHVAPRSCLLGAGRTKVIATTAHALLRLDAVSKSSAQGVLFPLVTPDLVGTTSSALGQVGSFVVGVDFLRRQWLLIGWRRFLRFLRFSRLGTGRRTFIGEGLFLRRSLRRLGFIGLKRLRRSRNGENSLGKRVSAAQLAKSLERQRACAGNSSFEVLAGVTGARVEGGSILLGWDLQGLTLVC